MRHLAAIATLMLACRGKTPEPPPVNPGSQLAARAPLVVRETGVGPIDGTTKVTEEAIRPLFPGYDVKSAYPPGLSETNNLGPPDLVVSADGERLLIILQNEAGTVMSVRATSPQVSSEAGWRVGDKVADPSRFAGCECIGDGLTCFAKSSHIGAVLDDDCLRNMEASARAGKPASAAYRDIFVGEPAALATLKGRSIVMLRWMPRAFDDPSRDDDPPPPEE